MSDKRREVQSTLAGVAGQKGDEDGNGSAARFNSPFGIAVDGASNIYVTDRGNGAVRKITPSGIVTTLAGTAADFYEPTGFAVDSAGSVYVADTAANVIRKFSATGLVTVFAGTPEGDGTSVGGKLCRSSEQAIFSCHVKGKKIVSVCASRIVTSKRGYMQYRYGTPQKIELTYPSTKSGPVGKFKKNFNEKQGGMEQTTYSPMANIRTRCTRTSERARPKT